MTDDLYVRHYDRQDQRLGRVVVHDPRSRAFALAPTVDKSTWRTKTIRIYDPIPNPDQVLGDCTGCAKSMAFNSVGSRIPGVVLGMKTADKIYSLATTLDPFPGSYPPTDTGSSSLGAAKAAQQLGLGGAYSWIFNHADGVVQAIMSGRVVNCGTDWYEGMFQQDSKGVIEPTGGVAGGHEYLIRGYNAATDMLLGRCWWGPSFRDFYIRRTHLSDLLAAGGDAVVQERANPVG